MESPRSAPGGVPRKELLMGRQHSVDAGLKAVHPRDKRATPVNTGEKLSLHPFSVVHSLTLQTLKDQSHIESSQDFADFDNSLSFVVVLDLYIVCTAGSSE